MTPTHRSDDMTDKLREALARIAEPKYGLQGIMEDYSDANSFNYHAMKYWRDLAVGYGATARAALAAAPQPEGVEAKIYAFLRGYRQEEVQDEDGYGYPLVDALTLDGHGIDMGEREIFNLAREIAHMLGAPAPQPAPDVAISRDMIDAAYKALPPDACGTIAEGEMERVLMAALRAAAPQPASVDRNALADLITDAELRWQSEGPHTGPTKSLAIADALLAAGLRLPGAVRPTMRDETGMEHIARDIREGRFPKRSPRQQVPDTPDQPAETLAWGAVNKDSAIQPDLISKDRVVAEGLAKDYAERVVRVAIRIVEDEA